MFPPSVKVQTPSDILQQSRASRQSTRIKPDYQTKVERHIRQTCSRSRLNVGTPSDTRQGVLRGIADVAGFLSSYAAGTGGCRNGVHGGGVYSILYLCPCF